ncbi:hypothetical protein Pelo_16413 [Pelomyxa schiedti]|nr:hypothetical protein Pelo_16413 [Pelomyxa schiedti]
MVPSHAVMLVQSNEDQLKGQFVVVDVAAMYLTKKLQVLSTTNFRAQEMLGTDGVVDDCLMMETPKAGQPVFIVATYNDHHEGEDIVVRCLNPNGVAAELSSTGYVSDAVLFQVDASRFAVNPMFEPLELWDISDTTKELPTINPEGVCVNPKLTYQVMHLIEVASRNTVARIEFLAPGWCIYDIFQEGCYLW